MSSILIPFLEMLAATFAVGALVILVAMRCTPFGYEDDFGFHVSPAPIDTGASTPSQAEERQLVEAMLVAHKSERPPFSFRDRLAA